MQNEIPGQKKTASPLRKEICEKLDPLFVEVGLERKNHRIYEVEGDGACACNCVGVHCHGDQKLGKYVRRNMNQYLVDFFPFFRPFYTWPHAQIVGSKSEPFNDEKEYLDFLRDEDLDHYGWTIRGYG